MGENLLAESPISVRGNKYNLANVLPKPSCSITTC